MTTSKHCIEDDTEEGDADNVVDKRAGYKEDEEEGDNDNKQDKGAKNRSRTKLPRGGQGQGHQG